MGLRALLCAGLSILALVACTSNSQLPIDLEALRLSEPLSEAFDFTYLYSDSAFLKAKMEAPHDIEVHDPVRKEPRHTFDKGFKLVFYSRSGAVESDISSRRGMLWKRSGLAVAEGTVRLVNQKGELLETEKLYWDRTRGQIYTDAPIKITTSKEVIYGTGMESDVQFKHYKVFRTRGILKLGT